MAISKEKKEELVAEYVELLNKSKAIFLTQYSGLDVKQMENLRAEVHKSEGLYRVTKNTLLIHALKQAGRPAPAELLVGQLATGFALNEAPTVAKTLVDFAKKEEGFFEIKGGIIGEDLLTVEQVVALARLPSRDELRAQLIGLISSPARNLASTVASGVRQVVNVVDAYSKQELEAEGSAG